MDAPGPWGTGPFTLAEGWSTLATERATMRAEPLACTWLWHELRTPTVRLVANEGYWDRRRGPYLAEVVFRNDLSPERALELVCDTEGEVDLLSEVRPADAERVASSAHARLVAVDALRSVVGIIDRSADGLAFGDRRARLALNHAVDRDALIAGALGGHGRPLAGLTPPASLTSLDKAFHRLSPYAHDPERAARLWADAGGADRPLRIATPERLQPVADHVAADFRAALGIEVEVTVHAGAELVELRRRLAERTGPNDWDVLIWEQGLQAADAPPLELHHALVGEVGEYRAGPVVAEFERRWTELVGHTAKLRVAQLSDQLDRYVYDEALALFLVAPAALYAVNRHVDFVPNRATLELAGTSVGEGHWSRR